MKNHNANSANAIGLPNSPHDRLCIAISILQAHYLASDTMLVSEAVFGTSHFPTLGFEHAIHLLIGLLGDFERIEMAQS